MKGRSLLGFGVSLAILGAGSLPVFAQSQQYPTDAQMRELTGSFDKVPSSVSGRRIDRRLSSDIQATASFVRDWSRVDPAVAPFLGSWQGIEESISIFPSNVRGRVCIVSSFLGSDRPDASFSLGSVSNGQIRTSGTLGRALITKQGNRLGLAGLNKNAPYISAFEFPIPLKSPTDPSFFGSLVSQTTKFRLIQEFNAAGCTASLPTRQSDSTVAQSRQTIQSLPDGDYLYGEVSYANKIGSQYVVFRKSGNVITGIEYYKNTDNGSCFRGTVNSNTITNVTAVDAVPPFPDPVQYEVSTGKTLDLSRFYRVNGVDNSVDATAAITRCNQQLANIPGTPNQSITGRAPTTTASGQELVASNLGCTSNLRNILGQSAPDYCTSAEANSGILFDEFKVSRNSDRSIKLEMRVFNRGSANGLVEVYDSKGHLEGVKIIDGNVPPTGLIQSGRDLFTKVPASLFSRYPLGDSRRELEEQNISVTIPYGGSVTISKSSNTALWYNVGLLAIEIALGQGDPEFTKSETARKFLVGFAQEFGKKGAINIFTGEASIQAVFSLDFIDKNKLAEVLQKLVQYSVTIESDPFKNPLIKAFSDVSLDTANIGIENALDKYILPGLGTVVRNVRLKGNAANTFARFADLRFAMNSGDNATITLRDATSTYNK